MKKLFWSAIAIVFLTIIAACSIAATQGNPTKITIRAEIWADNWFALYNGETLIKEDSVPITTERSFNAESFTFEATSPLQLNFIVKDYKANDTGLEYIGTPRQQMGDGGLIAQFTDLATGKVIAVTNENAVIFVIHKAPLNTACAKESSPVAGQGLCTFKTMLEPTNWKNPDFNDSNWTQASRFTAAQISPKEGYLEITWNPQAQFIWSSDLLMDNTVLIRMTSSFK